MPKTTSAVVSPQVVRRSLRNTKASVEEPSVKRANTTRNLSKETKSKANNVSKKLPVNKTKGKKKINSQMGSSGNEEWKTASSVYDFTVNDASGQPVSLEKYRGHVLIIVNVASRCGLTATNYKELVDLDEKYRDSKGLRILAFPCNQFSNQEPGTAEDVVCFAKKKNATFDIFDKIEVNGDGAHPLWKYLKYKQGGTFGDNIKWNFTKFIVDKNGQPVERFAPTTAPHKLVSDLEKYF